VTVTVRNAGPGVAPATFASIHLSADSVTSGTDTSIGYAYFGSLASGAEQTVTATVTVPAGMLPGSYYLGAIADTFNAAAEDNENNNSTTAGQFTVSGP
jgi:subtilase family serine protease